MPLRLKTFEMVKEQESKVELPRVRATALAFRANCSTTELELPPAATPHSYPYVASSSGLLIVSDGNCIGLSNNSEF